MSVAADDLDAALSTVAGVLVPATGCTELPGLPRRTQWRWHGAPLDG